MSQSGYQNTSSSVNAFLPVSCNRVMDHRSAGQCSACKVGLNTSAGERAQHMLNARLVRKIRFIEGGVTSPRRWTEVNPPSLSYLATWQQGKGKLMAGNAGNIPEPDAHLPSTQSSSSSSSSSSLGFKVHQSLLWVLWPPPSSSNTDIPSAWGSLRAQRCHGRTERNKSQWLISVHWLVRLFVCLSVPSAEEGMRVRRLKMTPLDTSSAPGVGYMKPTAGSPHVYKIWQHHCAGQQHAGFPQSTEKAKSCGNVKMSLEYPHYDPVSWWVGSSRGEENANRAVLRPLAVPSVHRTGKGDEKTNRELSPS